MLVRSRRMFLTDVPAVGSSARDGGSFQRVRPSSTGFALGRSVCRRVTESEDAYLRIWVVQRLPVPLVDGQPVAT